MFVVLELLCNIVGSYCIVKFCILEVIIVCWNFVKCFFFDLKVELEKKVLYYDIIVFLV